MAGSVRKDGNDDEAYRDWFYYAITGMSHTVTSRELVRQVPIQKRLSPPLYSLRDFVPPKPPIPDFE